MYRKSFLHRTGITLTELLVVVSIIVLVTSALLPMLRPVLKGQKTREAARQLNVFLAGAQAQAIERGRPVGVWIERAGHADHDAPLSDDDALLDLKRNYTAHRVYLAEEPVAYAGDIFDARVEFVGYRNDSDGRVDDLSDLQNVEFQFIPLDAGISARRLVKNGDSIRFDYRGPSFTIRNGVDGNGELDTRLTPPGANGFVVDMSRIFDDMAQLNNASPSNAANPTAVFDRLDQFIQQKYGNAALPFQVFRIPSRSVASPIELPNNVGIDLQFSGYSLDGSGSPTLFGGNLERDIVIMFSPHGGVDRVCWIDAHGNTGAISDFAPLGTITLLVARDDLIGENEILKDGNPRFEDTLEDMNNIWLSIDVRTGRVTSAPNAGPQADSPDAFIPVVAQSDQDEVEALMNRVRNSRRLARQGQSMGGR